MTDEARLLVHRASVFLVVAAELAFLVYFFGLDLPNADRPGKPGEKISRMDVWLLALPGFVPDGRCLAADALVRLTTWDYLPQRIPIAVHALLIVLAAISVGAGLLRLVRLPFDASSLTTPQQQAGPFAASWTKIERFVLAYGIGMSALSLATLAIGLAGWMNRAGVLTALLVAVVVAGVVAWRSGRARRAEQPRGGRAPAADYAKRLTPLERLAFAAGFVAVGLFLASSFLGAMLPATDFDVREYHLQGPKEFYQAGRIEFLPHNIYTSMPFGTEMLSLLGMIVAGDWWWGALVGQTVLATFAPMTALGVWSLDRRLFGPVAGWIGGLVYITTPWVYRIAIIPYTENALCFFLLAGTLAVVLALQSDDPRRAVRFWLLAGLLAGSAASCKYPALVSTVLPLGLVAVAGTWLRRRLVRAEPVNRSTDQPVNTAASCLVLRTSAAFVLGVAIACGPWLLKNGLVTGNPTYPLLYRVVGGRNWTPEKNAKWEWGHRVPLLVALGLQRPPDERPINPYDSQHAITLGRLAANLIDVTAQADWQSPLVFGLAPLALLDSRSRRVAGWLWLLVAYLFFAWWLLTHRLDRFWVPLLPVAAVLAGAGAVWNSGRLWRSFLAAVLVAVVFYNFSYSSTGLCGNYRYSGELVATNDPINPAVNWMNANLPESVRVLSVGAADLFHLDRPLAYNTVFDDSIFERLVARRDPQSGRSVLREAHEAAAALREYGVTHVYVSWAEIARYRKPGSYGFSEFVQPWVFEELVAGGVLRPSRPLGPDMLLDGETLPTNELYQVNLSLL
jgi:hypothetical protein